MTAGLPPFLDRIQTETQKAREALAEDLFNLDMVRSTVAAAAGQGLAVAVIRPPYPVDLTHTEAAKAAVKHLKDSGFKVGWECYRAEWEGRPTDGWELQIVWVF